MKTIEIRVLVTEHVRDQLVAHQLMRQVKEGRRVDFAKVAGDKLTVAVLGYQIYG